MPDFATWGGGESQPAALGSLIPLKPTSIVAVRNGAALAAQTVRLETLSSQRQVVDENGRTHMIDGMALGYRNHPTVTDTNLKAGDTFKADGTNYEVVALAPGMTDNMTAYLRVRS